MHGEHIFRWAADFQKPYLKICLRRPAPLHFPKGKAKPSALRLSAHSTCSPSGKVASSPASQKGCRMPIGGPLWLGSWRRLSTKLPVKYTDKRCVLFGRFHRRKEPPVPVGSYSWSSIFPFGADCQYILDPPHGFDRSIYLSVGKPSAPSPQRGELSKFK